MKSVVCRSFSGFKADFKAWLVYNPTHSDTARISQALSILHLFYDHSQSLLRAARRLSSGELFELCKNIDLHFALKLNYIFPQTVVNSSIPFQHNFFERKNPPRNPCQGLVKYFSFCFSVSWSQGAAAAWLLATVVPTVSSSVYSFAKHILWCFFAAAPGCFCCCCSHARVIWCRIIY